MPFHSSNGHALDRHAAVADRAEHQARLERLVVVGGLGAQAAVAAVLELVAHQLDRLDLAVALDLHRRAQEAQHHALGLARGLALASSR